MLSLESKSLRRARNNIFHFFGYLCHVELCSLIISISVISIFRLVRVLHIKSEYHFKQHLIMFGSSASTNWILSRGVAMAFPTLSGPSSWIIDLFTKFWILLPSCHNGFKWKQVTHCSSCRMLVYLPFLSQKGIYKSLFVLELFLLLLYDCRLQAWVFLHLGCERLGGKREKIRQSWISNPVTMITR